jgi:surfeit locus 1 family protein
MRLRPSAASSLALLPLTIACVWLGIWQMDRMCAKQVLMEQFESAPQLDMSQAIARERQFAHVRANGRYQLGWHLLLDNKIQDGRAGVHVLTLFQPDRGEPILVNRGWLPLPADRRTLPEIPTPPGLMEISGILTRPAEDGFRLGEPERLGPLNGAHLITYLQMGQIERALGGGLSPWIVQLDSTNDSGFGRRDWSPAVILPAQHAAYAVQWFALALATVIIWLTLGWRRAQSSEPGTSSARPGENRVEP